MICVCYEQWNGFVDSFITIVGSEFLIIRFSSSPSSYETAFVLIWINYDRLCWSVYKLGDGWDWGIVVKKQKIVCSFLSLYDGMLVKLTCITILINAPSISAQRSFKAMILKRFRILILIVINGQVLSKEFHRTSQYFQSQIMRTYLIFNEWMKSKFLRRNDELESNTETVLSTQLIRRIVNGFSHFFSCSKHKIHLFNYFLLLPWPYRLTNKEK